MYTWSRSARNHGGQSKLLQITPPSPYSYGTFMKWLRENDFKSVEGLKWPPEVAEFDIDAAARGGKFGQWMKGHDGDTAVSVAKSINKFEFLEEIMVNGDLSTIGGPGTHLYVFRRLLGAATGVKGPTFLDAGCGPGYLLMAWVLATGPGSRAVGADIDEAVIAAARRHLHSEHALDASVAKIPDDASMEVHVGDALNPDPKTLGLDPGTVDAINVGLAVNALEDLAPLIKLLRVGGKLLAPICRPPIEQSSDVPRGKCDGFLKTFQKTDDGKVQREAQDPDIAVRFIVTQQGGSFPVGLRGGHRQR